MYDSHLSGSSKKFQRRCSMFHARHLFFGWPKQSLKCLAGTSAEQQADSKSILIHLLLG